MCWIVLSAFLARSGDVQLMIFSAKVQKEANLVIVLWWHVPKSHELLMMWNIWRIELPFVSCQNLSINITLLFSVFTNVNVFHGVRQVVSDNPDHTHRFIKTWRHVGKKATTGQETLNRKSSINCSLWRSKSFHLKDALTKWIIQLNSTKKSLCVVKGNSNSASEKKWQISTNVRDFA